MTNLGDGHDKSDDLIGDTDNSNVVPLKVPRKKAPNSKKSDHVKTTIRSSTSWGKNIDDSVQYGSPNTASVEPLLNMPPYTKYMLAVLIGVHLIVAILLNEEQAHWVYINLGFIPGRFTGAAIFEPLALLTPLTHIFLHGSWLHIGMNSIMLLAFGSGVEKWIGGRKMLQLFFLCCLFGLLTHFALNFDSYQPVIGASGGLSGLFAATLVMLNRRHNTVQGKYGYWPLIGLWVGISVLFGMLGSPDGEDIAWAAHVGGFLGGFWAIKILKI